MYDTNIAQGELYSVARQDLRSHVENQIRYDVLDLTCTTERRGSPHTLICTKNQNSYGRRVGQRREDLASLARLGTTTLV